MTIMIAEQRRDWFRREGDALSRLGMLSSRCYGSGARRKKARAGARCINTF